MTISYQVHDRVAHIALDRPEKHNALRDGDIEELVAVLRRLDGDEQADVAILSGKGPSFCAGTDVKERLLASIDDGVGSHYRPDETKAVLRCANFKPIVAAVHGYVLGHAVGTALLCDFVVADVDAVFQVTEVPLGVPVPACWGLIAHHAGPTFANDVVMTGRRFAANEAFSAGLVTRLVDSGQHVSAAEELAGTLLENPQAAVREMVRLRRSVVAEHIQRCQNIGGVFRWDLTPEFRERIRARQR